ncbi:hypothetical protein HD554DRAFT_38653 [Boletus coccyginus]|nr:hypothetical protein HD554DRAFT_38653 [Boletus coccyginus]
MRFPQWNVPLRDRSSPSIKDSISDIEQILVKEGGDITVAGPGITYLIQVLAMFTSMRASWQTQTRTAGPHDSVMCKTLDSKRFPPRQSAELLSMPPLLSEQAAFAKHLFMQGYPLWSPHPGLLPQARQSTGLRIGDVGTVDERGEFDVFFNILEATPGSADSLPIFPSIEDVHVRRDGGDILPLVR